MMLTSADLKDTSLLTRLPDRVPEPSQNSNYDEVDLAELSLANFDEYRRSPLGKLDQLANTNEALVAERQIYEAAEFLRESMGWDPPPAGLFLFTLDAIWSKSNLPKPADLMNQCLEAFTVLEYGGVSQAPLQSGEIYAALRAFRSFENSARLWLGHHVDSPGYYLKNNDRPVIATDFRFKRRQLNEWLANPQAIDLTKTQSVAERVLETKTLSPGALVALNRFCLVSIQLHTDSLRRLLGIFSKFIEPSIGQSKEHLTIAATCGTRFYHHLRTEIFNDPKIQKDFAELYAFHCEQATEAGQKLTENNHNHIKARALAQVLLFHDDVASACFGKLAPLYEDLLSFVELAADNTGLLERFLALAGDRPSSADHDIQVLALLRNQRFCSFFDRVEGSLGLRVSELKFIFENRSLDDQIWLCGVIEALVDNYGFYRLALNTSNKKLPQATLDFIKLIENDLPSERQKNLSLLNYFADYARSLDSGDAATSVARFIAESVGVQRCLPTVEQWTVYKAVLETFRPPTPAQINALFSSFPHRGSGEENQRARVQVCTAMLNEHSLTEEAFFLILERAPLSYMIDDSKALAELVAQLTQKSISTQLISQLLNRGLLPSDILKRGLPKQPSALAKWIEELSSSSNQQRKVPRIVSTLREPFLGLGILIYEQASTSNSEWIKRLSETDLLARRIKRCAGAEIKPQRTLRRFGIVLGVLQDSLEFQQQVEGNARFESELLPMLQLSESAFRRSVDTLIRNLS